MKWFKPLYYVVVSLVSACLLIACIAFPLALLLAVPIAVFLFMVPSILQSEKFKSAELKAAREKVAELQGKLDRQNVSRKTRDALLVSAVPVMPGEFYEYYVANLLGERGYSHLDVTPKSGDFGADIIAMAPDGSKVCVQCKRYTNAVGLEAVQEVAAARTYYGCDKAIVATNSTFTTAAKELAKKTGVELWERFI